MRQTLFVCWLDFLLLVPSVVKAIPAIGKRNKEYRIESTLDNIGLLTVDPEIHIVKSSKIATWRTNYLKSIVMAQYN